MNDLINYHESKALDDALGYAQKFRDKYFVVKYGGAALTDARAREGILKTIILLENSRINMVLVHGGGDEISDLIPKLGGRILSKVDGIRPTDEIALAATEYALSKINMEIVNYIHQYGGRAAGLNGVSSKMIIARKKQGKVDYGLVGEIESVDPTPIFNAIQYNKSIPVVCPVSSDGNGTILNVNADEAAYHIAAALKAEKLIFLTDKPGILSDKDDETSRIPTITTSKLEERIKEGTINGGMIPKSENATYVLEQGVKKIHIVDGRDPNALKYEILTKEGTGTEIILG